MQLRYLRCWAQDDNNNSSHLSGPANKEREKNWFHSRLRLAAGLTSAELELLGLSRLQTPESKRLHLVLTNPCAVSIHSGLDCCNRPFCGEESAKATLRSMGPFTQLRDTAEYDHFGFTGIQNFDFRKSRIRQIFKIIHRNPLQFVGFRYWCGCNRCCDCWGRYHHSRYQR
jgi:hypothetical protein